MPQIDQRIRDVAAKLPLTDSLRRLAANPKAAHLLEAAARLPNPKLQSTAIDYFTGFGGAAAISMLALHGAEAKGLLPYLKEDLLHTSKLPQTREVRHRQSVLYCAIAHIDPKTFSDILRDTPQEDARCAVGSVVINSPSGRGDTPIIKALMQSDVPAVKDAAASWYNSSILTKDLLKRYSLPQALENATTLFQRKIVELFSGEEFRALVLEPITRGVIRIGILFCKDEYTPKLQNLLKILNSAPGTVSLE